MKKKGISEISEYIKINLVDIRWVSTGFLCVALLFTNSCRTALNEKVIPMESITWLNGRWSIGASGHYENFVFNDGNYIERVIFLMEDGQPVISERARIFEKDGSLAMTTTVFDEQFNELSMYELVDQKFRKIKFRNTRDDNPFTITFELTETGIVRITEADRSGKVIKKYELSRHDLP